MSTRLALNKPINSAVAWVIIACAVTAFICVSIVLYGDARVAAIKQQGAIAVNATNNYYAIKWLHIPGTKKPLVIPPAKIYKNIDGTWLLVNKTKTIPLNYVPTDLVELTLARAYNNSDPATQVRVQAVQPLQQLFDAAKKEGHGLTVRSAYRSAATQQLYYNEALVGGRTEYVAVPGQSEHQTGLAVDINNQNPACGSCDLDAETAEWLAANAYHYGFIIRYESGNEQITGYNAEPWHLRYVGTLLATKLHESGLTLEEFTQLILKK